MSAVIVAPAAAAAAVVITLLRPARLARLPTTPAVGNTPPAPRAMPSLQRPLGLVLVLLGAMLLFALAGPVPGCVAATAIHVAHRMRSIRSRRRASAAVNAAYPEFLDLLVLTIGAGFSPREAFTVLADVVPLPLHPGVHGIARAAAAGERFADTLTRLRDPPPHGIGPIAQPLADALALADRHGTPLPPILERLAAEAREHRRRQADIAARQLPIRLAFPLVGCTFPSFVLLTVVPLMAGTFSSLRGLSP